MPTIAANIVDAYVFRKVNARVQFLLLLRRPDLSLGNSWQSLHARIETNETALTAARRAVKDALGHDPVEAYSVDYINQFYDHESDTIILAPVFAFTLPRGAQLDLGDDFIDSAWCDLSEATARLPWSGQHWAVRNIDAVIGQGGPDAEFYRITTPPAVQSHDPLS